MFLTLCLVFVTSLIFFLWRRFTFWSRQGINGPKFVDFKAFREEHHEFCMDMDKKYGRIYGGYGITDKVLVVNEPDLIKDIFVKNFNVFPHHKLFNISPSPSVNQMLFFMPGDEHWRRVRSILSPAFTSGKLKAMMSRMSGISDNFVKNLEKHEKNCETVDIRQYIGCFAMDVISACAYGIEIDSLNDPDHPVVQNAKSIFGVNATLSMILSVMAPGVAKILRLEFLDKKATNFFNELTNQIVSERKINNKSSKKDKSKRETDFLQLMLDSEKSNKELGYDSTDSETEENESPAKRVGGILTPDEMTSQGILFFIAGYDTTSAALSHLVYYLAKNNDCQQRLYEELKDLKEFSYEKLSQLKYLNAVIDETLRLAPSLLRIQRQAEQDFILNGIKITKGTSVEILPYVLHRYPEFWPDPLEFKPERFLNPSHNPWAYLPFGGGPRMCIGQRFSLNEIRMCASKLFNRFEFSLVPGFKLEYFKGSIMLSPKTVMVNLQLRK